MRFAASIWLLGALGALLVGVLLAVGAVLSQRAIRRSGKRSSCSSLPRRARGGRRALKGVLLVLSLGLSFVALAQPQYGRGSRVIPATNLGCRDRARLLEEHVRARHPAVAHRAGQGRNDPAHRRFAGGAFRSRGLRGRNPLVPAHERRRGDPAVSPPAVAERHARWRHGHRPSARGRSRALGARPALEGSQESDGARHGRRGSRRRPVQESQAAAQNQITIYVDQIGRPHAQSQSRT